MNSQVFNMDCLEGMKQYPDKYFELAIVDPPYGIKMHGGSRQYNTYTNKEWDNGIPPKEYFEELRRVSENQIIWGGNYFTEFLYPSRCWMIWDKTLHGNTFADGEMAWTSFDKNTRILDLNINANQGKRFHPTQKPVKLYKWVLDNLAKQGDKILDTHLGSGSSRIACYEAGYDFTGYELDKEYFDASEERFQKYISQGNMFREAVKEECEQLAIV
jgi:site-specific DNA-methyltransferase (adenine-specific)